MHEFASTLHWKGLWSKYDMDVPDASLKFWAKRQIVFERERAAEIRYWQFTLMTMASFSNIETLAFFCALAN
jgi:hypothetical protein